MGRPKGSKNKNASKFQQLFDKYVREYNNDPIKTGFELLGESTSDGEKNPKAIRVQAMSNLMPYAYSKKTEEKKDEAQKAFNFGWADDEYQAVSVKETNPGQTH